MAIIRTITAPSLAAPAASSVYMGPRGLSAYEVALQNGFSGSEEAWIASLEGAQGPTGPAGPIHPAVQILVAMTGGSL